MKKIAKNLFAVVVLVFSVAIMSNMGPTQAAGTVKSVTITSPTTKPDYRTDRVYRTTGTVKASISVSGGASKTIYYKSSNPSVVVVDKTTGAMSYKKAGKATITAYAKANSSKKDTLKIEVYTKGIQRVEITAPTSATTYTINRTTYDTTRQIKQNVVRRTKYSSNVTYSTDKPSVASVTSKGVLTAKGPGKAKIIVRSKVNSAIYDSMYVIVNQRITKISASVSGSFAKDDAGTYYTYPGKKLTTAITYTPSNATTKKVTYSSSSPRVAAVSSSGVITAKKTGTTTITVTAADGSKKTTSFKVSVKSEPKVRVSSVAISGASSYIDLKNSDPTMTLKAIVAPSNATNKTIAWSSSDKSVATVSTAGKVTFLKNGEVKITARATDGSGKSATKTIKVYASTTKVSLNKTELSIAHGSAATLTAILESKNGLATGDTFSYVAEDRSIVVLEQNGKSVQVHGLAIGTTNINIMVKNARTGDETKMATCKVTVTPRAITSITADTTKTATVKESQTIELKSFITVAPTDYEEALVWSSSDSKIATVNADGYVTGVKEGSATITVCAKSNSAIKAEIPVKVESSKSTRQFKINTQKVVDGINTGSINLMNFAGNVEFTTGEGFYDDLKKIAETVAKCTAYQKYLPYDVTFTRTETDAEGVTSDVVYVAKLDKDGTFVVMRDGSAITATEFAAIFNAGGSQALVLKYEGRTDYDTINSWILGLPELLGELNTDVMNITASGMFGGSETQIGQISASNGGIDFTVSVGGVSYVCRLTVDGEGLFTWEYPEGLEVGVDAILNRIGAYITIVGVEPKGFDPNAEVAEPVATVAPEIPEEVVEEPTVEVVEEPTQEVIEEPTVEAVEKPEADVTEEPATEAVEKLTEEPAEKPEADVTGEPAAE